MKFNVTYEIITQESAEEGDIEDCGFIIEDVSLRDALSYVHPTENSGAWWTEYGEMNWRDGSYENRSLHAAGRITEASRKRISRLLRIR